MHAKTNKEDNDLLMSVHSASLAALIAFATMDPNEVFSSSAWRENKNNKSITGMKKRTIRT
jgi:hypothetical protein